MDVSRAPRRSFQPILDGLESRALLTSVQPLDGSLIVAWNESALDAIRATQTAPPIAARNLAILQVSVLSAVESTSRLASGSLAARNDALEGAVNGAARRALVQLFPSQAAEIEGDYATRMADIPAGRSRSLGAALGDRQGQRELGRRSADGATDSVPYTPGTEPGDWRPTPPAFASALLPQWPGVDRFVGRGAPAVRYRPPGPPDLASAAYARALEEVERLGSASSTERTADQTEIARFWADGAGTETPPGHWNSIAGEMSQARGLNLLRTARLFATLDVALADAAIACWDCKYDHDFWRPVTAIRQADQDANDATTADPTWTPLLTTPPFPSYVSGHSTFSSAAATVLSAYLGGKTPFSTSSDAMPGTTRAFESFYQAAEEAGMSRIYGGIHYSFDNEDGQALGRSVGQVALRSAAQGRLTSGL
ncbi:MAG: phosphatase PAP2 family protein [Isosphaeraceae bacterium]